VYCGSPSTTVDDGMRAMTPDGDRASKWALGLDRRLPASGSVRLAATPFVITQADDVVCVIVVVCSVALIHDSSDTMRRGRGSTNRVLVFHSDQHHVHSVAYLNVGQPAQRVAKITKG